MILLLIISIILVLFGMRLLVTGQEVKTLSKGTFLFPKISFLSRLTVTMLGNRNPEPGYQLKNWEKKGFGIFFIIIGLVMLGLAWKI